jgi:hypothetical protein
MLSVSAAGELEACRLNWIADGSVAVIAAFTDIRPRFQRSRSRLSRTGPRSHRTRSSGPDSVGLVARWWSFSGFRGVDPRALWGYSGRGSDVFDTA